VITQHLLNHDKRFFEKAAQERPHGRAFRQSTNLLIGIGSPRRRSLLGENADARHMVKLIAPPVVIANSKTGKNDTAALVALTFHALFM
jgi:hypothetical protein